MLLRALVAWFSQTSVWILRLAPLRCQPLGSYPSRSSTARRRQHPATSCEPVGAFGTSLAL